MLAITGPCQSARWTGGILWQAPGKAETYNYTLWFGRFWGFLPPQLLREIDHPRSKTLPQYHNLDKGNPSKLPYILASSLNPTQKWVNTICGPSIVSSWYLMRGYFYFYPSNYPCLFFQRKFPNKNQKNMCFSRWLRTLGILLSTIFAQKSEFGTVMFIP